MSPEVIKNFKRVGYAWIFPGLRVCSKRIVKKLRKQAGEHLN
jgi:hypothetical protein